MNHQYEPLSALNLSVARQSSLPSMEALLSNGGDTRIVFGPDGVNKYGCFSFPQSDVLSFASSTASTISAAGFAAALQLCRRLETASLFEPAAATYEREMARIRGELLALFDLTSRPAPDVIFGASGTDLHLIAAQLLCHAGAPLFVIGAESSETGSGVPDALRGCHFSGRTALGEIVTRGELMDRAEPIEVAEVKGRLENGDPRPVALVDEEVEAMAIKAVEAGRHVLLALTDVSKTGLVIPRPACAVALKRRFPERVDVLVDACQLRLANATKRAYLDQDFLVAVTGSKFVTGPAFSAAMLVPQRTAQRLRGCVPSPVLRHYSARADWPRSWAARSVLTDSANYGLLVRWEAALATLRAFHGLPEREIRRFLSTFAAAVHHRLAEDPAFEPLSGSEIERRPVAVNRTWDRIPTIFPFLVRRPVSGKFFNSSETNGIYELIDKPLGNDLAMPVRRVAALRCQLGQPAACGVRDGSPVSALRLCLDMRLILEALSPTGCGSHAVIANALRVLDKVAMLARQ